MNEDRPIVFAEYKQRIIAAAQQRLNEAGIRERDGFGIVDGFTMLGLQQEIGNDIQIGGPTLPVITLIGNTSGRVYHFALKVLLPDLDLK